MEAKVKKNTGVNHDNQISGLETGEEKQMFKYERHWILYRMQRK